MATLVNNRPRVDMSADDSALASSQDVSQARRRRHRTTRRGRSESLRASQLLGHETSRETPTHARDDGGGEEESSVHSDSAASSSARYRRSIKKRELKRCREMQQGREEIDKDEGENEGGATLHPLEEGGVAEEGDTPSLDDTTAQITSLLQRIEGEERDGDDHRSASPYFSPSPHPAIPPQPTLALTVHKADRLRADLNITHPLVRVCLVNGESGELVKKPYPGRRVTSYYEEGVDYILPVLTQPWKEKGHSLQPNWEETLLFNEDLSLFTSDPNLLFFELLDFPTPHNPTLTPSTHSSWKTNKRQGQGDSWYHIAWGFLKAGGDRGTQHRERRGDGERGGGEGGEGGSGEGERGEQEGEGVKWRYVGKKCRLQLYCYPKGRKSPSSTVKLWDLWRSYKRKPYPSTLYVTLNEATPTTQQITPTIRSMDPSQPEVGRQSVEQVMSRLHSHHKHGGSQTSVKLLDVPSRLPGHTCHLPSSLLTHLHPSHTTGCSTLAFSPDGRYLGAGCISHGDTYSLTVYEVSTTLVAVYSDAHRGFIYSLGWSHDGHLISSASADGLVKVWSVVSCDEVASLPHPCYVYATRFVPTPPLTPHPPPSTPPSSHHYTLFTGAYDKIVRVWTLNPSRVQLIQELRGHRGHVNSICVASSGSLVFSGDSVGDVRVWSREETDLHVWQLQQTITPYKSPQPILSLCLHPAGRRLLIHSTTGRLAMIDLRV